MRHQVLITVACACCCACGQYGDYDMPTTQPPKGWYIDDPTNVSWTTDIDRSESVTDSGSYGIHFLDTTPSVDPAIITDLVAIPEDAPVSYGAFVQTDSIGASDWVRIDYYGYAADKTTLLGSDNVQVVLNAANTWQWIGSQVDPAGFGARWVQFKLSKNNLAYNAYFDRLEWTTFVASWGNYLNTPQAIPTGTWTTVDFDLFDSSPSPGGSFLIPMEGVSESAGVYEIGVPGQYQLSTSVEFDAFANGGQADIRFKITRSDGSSPRYRMGTLVEVSAGNGTRLVAVSQNEPLISGDLVQVQVWHNDGAPVNVIAGTEGRNTNIRGARMGVL